MRFVNKDIIEILKQCKVATIPDNIEDIPQIAQILNKMYNEYLNIFKLEEEK